MVGWRTGWAVALAVATLVAPAAAFADGEPVISAHRAGDVSGWAENSLASFELSARSGETDIEGDAFATRDGAFVMSHDSPLRAPRCAGPWLDVPLRSLTVAQVGEMTCSGEPVARLEDVVEAVRPYSAATLRIEVKNQVSDTGAARTADAVGLARLLARTGMTARSILQDSDWATTTTAVHGVSPGQRVSALTDGVTWARIASARSLGAHDVSYPQRGSTGFWNRVIAAQGLRSTVWTVNDPTRARALRAEGVGTIITNVPSTLRAALSAPDSGCEPTRFARATVVRGTTLAAGGRAYRREPRWAPDGRVVETALVRVTASTTSGTAVLRIGPQGTPYSPTWERSLTVTATPRTTTVEVALGDGGSIRIRNTSTRAVRLALGSAGGTVLTCW